MRDFVAGVGGCCFRGWSLLAWRWWWRWWSLLGVLIRLLAFLNTVGLALGGTWSFACHLEGRFRNRG